MATGEQYIRLVISFASIAAVSRLLTPGEIGVSVIGMGIVAIALNLREFATSDCLIQRQEVLRDDIRASFTVLFILTAFIVAVIFVLAPWFGTFYGEEKLARFLRIAAVAGLVEALSLPIKGLLRREMAFGILATINTTSVIVTASATVALACAGFSSMSIAWATLVGAGTTAVLSFSFRPDLSVLRPTIKAWGSILTFGGYNGASYVISVVCDELPQLFLGRMLSHSAVGMYERASVTAGIPDKVILTSVSSVAFPALAAEIRQNGALQEPYLRALGYITVLYWPPLVLITLLAHSVVSLVLGEQWRSVVPVLQVMAVAGLAWFPVMFTSPVLLAIGANRERALAVLLGRSVSAIVLCAAAYFGVMAMAASKLLTSPYQMILSLYFVRRHVSFGWFDVWAAIWKSAVVTAGSAVGPIGIVTLTGTGFDLSIPATGGAVILAVVGWLAGVYLTQHPVLLELRRATEAIVETRFVRRAVDRTPVQGPRAGQARS